MSKDRFIVNGDMFGAYVKIPTGLSKDMYIYKVIGRIESNRYCDVPIMGGMKSSLHSEIVPVLNVVHCGVSEDTVIRVALSDCEIVQPLNNPLTLDELREMDGEPVWVVQINGELRPTWMLVDAEDESAADRLCAAMFEDYGTEWLAYHRKLEEGTT